MLPPLTLADTPRVAMLRSLCSSLAAILLGCALAAAKPAAKPAPAPATAAPVIPAGTTLKLAASAKAQQIESPTALAFDGAGRLFITENPRHARDVKAERQHLAWYLDDLAANKTSDRLTLLEKWKGKIPPDYLTENSGRVRRLADVDGDGVFEESKVFAEGFNDPLDGAATGVLVVQDCVYLACSPKLWLLRDADGKGVAASRQVLQDGFGVRLAPRGHDMGGLTLGPDGRLYGVIGDRGLNLATKAGQTYQYPNEGCAFRIEPDGSGFEVFHTGLRNPKGIAFDALGNAFTVDGNSGHGDASRIIYLVEGGDSGWRIGHQTLLDYYREVGLSEAPPTRWLDEHMWELRHELQPAYVLPPSGHLASEPADLTIHPGTGFLEAEAGRFLICDHGGDAAHSGVISFAMIPDGAGMKLADSRPLLQG
ncbi:MAG: glucose dehydrogenase, partial [Verrucomicrobiota bacterium]